MWAAWLTARVDLSLGFWNVVAVSTSVVVDILVVGFAAVLVLRTNAALAKASGTGEDD